MASKKELKTKIKRLEHEITVLIDDPKSVEATEIRLKHYARQAMEKLTDDIIILHTCIIYELPEYMQYPNLGITFNRRRNENILNIII